MNKWTPPRNSGGIPERFSLSMEMSRLTRDRTAEPVSRDQIFRHERGQGNIHFSCSIDHAHDWQPYPVDPYSCYMCNHTIIKKIQKIQINPIDPINSLDAMNPINPINPIIQ